MTCHGGSFGASGKPVAGDFAPAEAAIEGFGRYYEGKERSTFPKKRSRHELGSQALESAYRKSYIRWNDLASGPDPGWRSFRAGPLQQLGPTFWFPGQDSDLDSLACKGGRPTVRRTGMAPGDSASILLKIFAESLSALFIAILLCRRQ